MARDFQLRANTAAGTPAADLFSTDTLATNVWRGADTPVLLNPVTAWVDATTGLYQVSFANADTTALEPGRYDGAVTATRAGKTWQIGAFFLDVEPAPGTRALRPVYCQYSDMLKWAPWLGDVQFAGVAEGFADQRADAREWYDNLVLRAYRGGVGGNFESHSEAAFAFAGGGHRQTGKSFWLNQMLDQNKLMLLPEVVKANACYAIALVCNGQIAQGDTYAREAARFFTLASDLVLCSTAQLDTSGSGYYSVAVPLGSANPLFT